MKFIRLFLAVSALFFFYTAVSADIFLPEMVVIIDPGHGGSDHGGYDGQGFKLNGKRVPEDEYVYDVSKRVERIIISSHKNWKVFFTVKDAVQDVIRENDESRILPKDQSEVFNFPEKPVKVYPEKEGLIQRMLIAENIFKRHRDSLVVFVSFHFDYAHPSVSGPKIIVGWSERNKIFAKTLKEVFLENGFKAEKDGKIRPMILGSGPGKDIDLFFFRGEVKSEIKYRALIELGNFMNINDRSILLNHNGRERYAQTVVLALEKFLAKPK